MNEIDPTPTANLSKLPDLPALQQLARALWHDGSIRGAALMVGAGFSKNAVLQAPDTPEPPSWSELLKELTDQLYPTDKAGAPTDALRIAEEYRTYFGQATLDGFHDLGLGDRCMMPRCTGRQRAAQIRRNVAFGAPGRDMPTRP
jgi:hypothetical protein